MYNVAVNDSCASIFYILIGNFTCNICNAHSQDGSMDKEKLSELCQTYSERFNIDPAQIMDTVSMICKATETKVSVSFKTASRYCMCM